MKLEGEKKSKKVKESRKGKPHPVLFAVVSQKTAYIGSKKVGSPFLISLCSSEIPGIRLPASPETR